MGIDGISIPCVLCRKSIEKNKITWSAYDGEKWVHSNKSNELPKSISTSKQKRNLGFI